MLTISKYMFFCSFVDDTTDAEGKMDVAISKKKAKVIKAMHDRNLFFGEDL